MKTPEEWTNDAVSPLVRCSCECEVRRPEVIAWIKAIQDDAIKSVKEEIQEKKSHWIM